MQRKTPESPGLLPTMPTRHMFRRCLDEDIDGCGPLGVVVSATKRFFDVSIRLGCTAPAKRNALDLRMARRTKDSPNDCVFLGAIWPCRVVEEQVFGMVFDDECGTRCPCVLSEHSRKSPAVGHLRERPASPPVHHYQPSRRRIDTHEPPYPTIM